MWGVVSSEVSISERYLDSQQLSKGCLMMEKSVFSFKKKKKKQSSVVYCLSQIDVCSSLNIFTHSYTLLSHQCATVQISILLQQSFTNFMMFHTIGPKKFDNCLMLPNDTNRQEINFQLGTPDHLLDSVKKPSLRMFSLGKSLKYPWHSFHEILSTCYFLKPHTFKSTLTLNNVETNQQ